MVDKNTNSLSKGQIERNKKFNAMIAAINNTNLTLNRKLKVVERTIGSKPVVNLSMLGLNIKAIFDTGSRLTVVDRPYYEENIYPLLTREQLGNWKNDHHAFTITNVSNSKVNIGQYLEIEIEILFF